ncbi:MAG TPA: hypothetical protein VFG99_00770, partial [Chloroflexia bacterium]|nr:hypothetical protein [Chloroflexia bacterium]
VATPCITGDIISPRRALVHPALEHAVAFLGAVEVAPLLDEIREGDTVQGILRQWSQQISFPLAQDIMHWLWAKGILVLAVRA